MADGHQLQSRLFASLGLSKLADKYAEHADEERGWVTKCIDRLLDLGAEVRLEDKKGGVVCKNPADWITSAEMVAAVCNAGGSTDRKPRGESRDFHPPADDLRRPKKTKKPTFFQRFHLTSCEFFV